mgnify:CR=1 FL=1
MTTHQGAGAFKGAKVLIVEDEFLVALQLEDMLRDAGHEVIGVVADRASLCTIGGVPQVALVDLNLRDGLPGPEIALDLARNYGTMVVYVTANPQQIAIPAHTAVGFISKPFSSDAILAAVGYALGGGGTAPPPDGLAPLKSAMH